MNITNRNNSKPEMIIVSVLMILLSFNLFAEENIYTVTDLRKLTAEWVRLKAEISAEKVSWEKEKNNINREIDLLNLEAEKLTKEHELLNIAFEKKIKEQADLQESKIKLDTLLTDIEPLVENVIVQLKSLKKLIPKALFNKVNTYYSSLESENTETTSEKLKILVELLREIEEMQSSIHYYKEVLTIENNPAREYEIISVGLSNAYCVATDNSIAGIGQPKDSGWQWFLRDDLAVKIRDAIDIYKQNKMAEYLDLPLSINEVVK